MRKEEVGTLDDVLEVGLAITVDQVGDVGNVDSFWSTTTWDKQVGLDSEVEVVSEICTVGDDLSSYTMSAVSSGIQHMLDLHGNWISFWSTRIW